MTGSGMTQALDPQALGELSPLALNHLLPERQALIGEFSPAYEAFREATIADLDPKRIMNTSRRCSWWI